MSQPIIEIKHLKKSYGQNEVLKDISLSVNKGEVISIIGSSGSGKSTFLRSINLLEDPTAGEILFHGQNFTLMVKDKSENNIFQMSKYQVSQIRDVWFFFLSPSFKEESFYLCYNERYDKRLSSYYSTSTRNR